MIKPLRSEIGRSEIGRSEIGRNFGRAALEIAVAEDIVLLHHPGKIVAPALGRIVLMHAGELADIEIGLPLPHRLFRLRVGQRELQPDHRGPGLPDGIAIAGHRRRLMAELVDDQHAVDSADIGGLSRNRLDERDLHAAAAGAVDEGRVEARIERRRFDDRGETVRLVRIVGTLDGLHVPGRSAARQQKRRGDDRGNPPVFRHSAPPTLSEPVWELDMTCIASGKPRARQPAEGDAGASSRQDNAALGFPDATLRATISEAWAALSLTRDAPHRVAPAAWPKPLISLCRPYPIPKQALSYSDAMVKAACLLSLLLLTACAVPIPEASPPPSASEPAPVAVPSEQQAAAPVQTTSADPVQPDAPKSKVRRPAPATASAPPPPPPADLDRQPIEELVIRPDTVTGFWRLTASRTIDVDIGIFSGVHFRYGC